VSLPVTVFAEENTMFENALRSSWNHGSRRGMTTLASFGVQALAVVLVLFVPLLRPTGSPLLRHISAPISLSEPPAVPDEALSRTEPDSGIGSEVAQIVLRQPTQIPAHLPSASDNIQPPIGGGIYIPGIEGKNGMEGIPGSLGTGFAPAIPKAPTAYERTIRLSHMSEGDLVHKVLPTYPALARNARIEGTVVLQAMISKLGTIENLRLVSGHPLLAPAAIDAVRQWRYRPYILNNEAVEVETQITVNFFLGN
jgi:periplasmic protein TonB